jgi:hypothetical protein
MADLRHRAPGSPARRDPVLWLELRLADELAGLRRLREAGSTTGRQLARIDLLLDRYHEVRPCGWCLGERLDDLATARIEAAATVRAAERST